MGTGCGGCGRGGHDRDRGGGALAAVPAVCLLFVFFLASFLTWPAAVAAEHGPYRIGVLAYQGKDKAMARWGAHGAYLSKHLSPLRFEIVPLGYEHDELRRAVMAHRVDFVITNPGQYTELEIGGYVSRLCTRHMAGPLGAVNQFGGAAFCRSDRHDLHTYADLAGKTIIIPSRSSLGGWQVHLREALEQGVDLRTAATIVAVDDYREVVRAVLAGRGDVGFVRSDFIAEMVKAGELTPDALTIINKKRVPGYPYVLSTRLYPEWPLAVVTGTSPQVAERVLKALFDMGPADAAARAAGISGWTIPGHYSKVQALFREVGLGPYAPAPPTAALILRKYRSWIIAVLLLFVALICHGLLSRRINRNLYREIAERRKAEAELREVNQRLTLAADSAGFGVWDYDFAADRLFCDATILRLFGREGGSFSGQVRDWEALVHHEDLKEVKRSLVRAMNGEVVAVEYRVTRADGAIRHVKTTAAPVRNAAGAVIRLTGIHEDITDEVERDERQRRMEIDVQLLQKYQSLNSMAAGIAHNFNNILAAVIGNLDLARMEGCKDREHHLECAFEAARRAARLSTMMLQFVGQVKIERVRIVLRELIEEMTAVLNPQIPPRVEILSSGEDSVWLKGDSGMVRQVVANLVLNAAEAMPEGRGRIRLRWGRRFFSADELRHPHQREALAAGEYVFLQVEDNGSGMEAEVARRAFDPFFTTKFTGRGMGLATVLGIMRTHKGSVTIDTEPGKGTTVSVFFPAPAMEPVAAGESGAGEMSPGRCRLSGTVLVVDDEPMLRELAEAALSRCGMRVLTADDGLEGLAVFKEHHQALRLVLLDISMPGMDGLELLGRIREIAPAMPVLLTTGYAVDRISADISTLGPGVGVLQKPFGLDALCAKVTELLGG